MLKFNNQRRSHRSISFCHGYFSPHYKDKYIIKKSSAIRFQLPSNHSEIVSEEIKFHEADGGEENELESGWERRRQRENMEMQNEKNESRSGQRMSKSNGRKLHDTGMYSTAEDSNYTLHQAAVNFVWFLASK